MRDTMTRFPTYASNKSSGWIESSAVGLNHFFGFGSDLSSLVFRYLLNSSELRGTGYLNIQLTPKEWDELKGVDGDVCTFGKPCFVRGVDGKLKGTDDEGRQFWAQRHNTQVPPTFFCVGMLQCVLPLMGVFGMVKCRNAISRILPRVNSLYVMAVRDGGVDRKLKGTYLYDKGHHLHTATQHTDGCFRIFLSGASYVFPTPTLPQQEF